MRNKIVFGIVLVASMCLISLQVRPRFSDSRISGSAIHRLTDSSSFFGWPLVAVSYRTIEETVDWTSKRHSLTIEGIETDYDIESPTNLSVDIAVCILLIAASAWAAHRYSRSMRLSLMDLLRWTAVIGVLLGAVRMESRLLFATNLVDQIGADSLFRCSENIAEQSEGFCCLLHGPWYFCWPVLVTIVALVDRALALIVVFARFATRIVRGRRPAIVGNVIRTIPPPALSPDP